METAANSCTPCKYAVYRKFQKSGLSNNIVCLHVLKLDFWDHTPHTSSIVSVVSHSSAVQKTKTENFAVLCVSHTKTIAMH